MERSDGEEASRRSSAPIPRAPRVPRDPKRSEHSRKGQHKRDPRTQFCGRLPISGTPCLRFPPAAGGNDTRFTRDAERVPYNWLQPAVL